jgi:precorrin-2 dehydrogenase/sirohydrochlorin ferrochelatase
VSYPVLLDVRQARILVVGGGAVALRKTQGVVDAGGRPTIIAPHVVPVLRVLAERFELTCHRRPYQSGDVGGYQLVFATTDRREVNAEVAREAKAQSVWVNVVDDPDSSSFQVPASIRQGEVTVALATGGASPLLSRRLRERLEEVVTPGVGRAAERLKVLRAAVHERWPSDAERRRALWFELITPEFLACAIAGQDEEVELRIARCLSQS